MLWRPHQRAVYASRKSLLSKPSKALILTHREKSGDLYVSDSWISNGSWIVRRSAMSALPAKPQAGIKYLDMHQSLTLVLSSVERASTSLLTVTDECYSGDHEDGEHLTTRTLKRRTGTPVYVKDEYIKWFSQLHNITYLAGATREDPVRVVRDNETVAVFSPYRLGACTLSFEQALKLNILPQEILDRWKIDTYSIAGAKKSADRYSRTARVHHVPGGEYVVLDTGHTGKYIVSRNNTTLLSEFTLLELTALGLPC